MLDTHAMVWFLQDSARLSRAANHAIQGFLDRGGSLSVSAISLAELIYLVEKGRMPSDTFTRLTRRLDDPDRDVEVVPFSRAVAELMPRIPRDVVPDMPDRIIAATAMHLNVPLISCDRKIRRLPAGVIW